MKAYPTVGILGFSDIPPLWVQWLQTFPVKQIVNHVTHGISVCDEYSQSTLHHAGVSRKIKAPALRLGRVFGDSKKKCIRSMMLRVRGRCKMLDKTRKARGVSLEFKGQN